MKAIALVSGGLDSTLAAQLIKELGIEIVIMNLKTPFCLCDKRGTGGCNNQAAQIAFNLGVEFKIINVTDEFFGIIKSPKHGYGSNINPCIDCRILLLRKAKELMQAVGASFVVTGEVLGQRPMSQHKQALRIIERESGLEGLVLRPLSAKLLPETIPEKNGWISRNRLLDFNGRTRSPQIELAETLGIKDYPCPAGGCLLTDPEFTKRIRDLMAHGDLNLNDVELLKIGRHFRLAPGTKIIVGRNERENSRLLALAKDKDYLFMPDERLAGPTSLGRGQFNEKLIELSCRITSRYCDLNGASTADIVYRIMPGSEDKLMKASPIQETELGAFRI